MEQQQLVAAGCWSGPDRLEIAVGIRHAIALVHTGWYKTTSSAAGRLQHLHAPRRSFGHVIKLATDSVGGYFEAQLYIKQAYGP